MTTDPVSSSICGGWLWMLQAVLRSSYLGRDDESASSNRELLDCKGHCCTDCDCTTVYGISRRCCSLIPVVSTSPNSKCFLSSSGSGCFWEGLRCLLRCLLLGSVWLTTARCTPSPFRFCASLHCGSESTNSCLEERELLCFLRCLR